MYKKVSTDLNFKDFTNASDYRRMQTLVKVFLGHCDIVFNPTRDRLPFFMDFT